MILSASRRTDIPARHMKWFMERLRDGQVLVRHPMNPHRVSRIFLSPDTIDLIVLITKDPGPLLSYLEELQAMGYHTAFQCTMTPYGRDLEPGLRPKNEIVRSIQELGTLMGKDKVVWRYDPILLNQNFSLSTHERAFERLCGALAANVDHVILSFLDGYPKLEPFYASGMMRALSETEMREAAARLAAAGLFRPALGRAGLWIFVVYSKGKRPARRLSMCGKRRYWSVSNLLQWMPILLCQPAGTSRR